MVLPRRDRHVDVDGTHLQNVLRAAAAEPLDFDHGPDGGGHQGEHGLDMGVGDRLDPRLFAGV